ncbi:hypothetical protein Pint_19048 [Pistacia integerrima]|uniref:Uncharacterized protein n=1 Tax=Pistacia integerrima TaxID=434235 RepID=A0ACC0YXK4_9ROSI|nr:hypothetical protein Pint_19048 [Pistacia integerrima]
MVSFLYSVIKWHFLYKRLSPLLLLFLSLLCFTWNGVVLAASDDKSVLIQFKNSLSDPSGLLSTWNLSNNSNHCSWSGVLCDSNSRVVTLNISGGGKEGNLSEAQNGFQFSCSDYAQFPIYGFGVRRNCKGNKGKLSGKLLSAIADLTELRILSLPFNGLHGEISKEIWGMKNLEVLDLEGNLLNGSLPLSFSGLKKLRVLNLGFNRIAGEISASFSDFVSLEVLNLAGNQVNGTVPAFVGRLRGVYLSFNKLGGSVSGEIGENCENLQHLDLSGNYLVGGIPQSLGKCFQLRSLLLNANMLEEVIPAELGMLQNLEVLDVSRNSLSGPIPVEVGNCSKLTVLVLSNLFDTFENVGSTRGDSPVEQSSSMNDDFNFFQGGFPEEVASLPNLRILWAPRATLEGKLPSNWGTCNNLEMLNLGRNFFTGEIPGALGHCNKLHFLDLSSNQLTGELAEELPVPCTTLFDVSGNSLSGSIPTFRSRACPPVPSLRGNLFESYDPPTAYLSFLTNKAQVGTPLPLLGGDNVLAIFHNFGVNNFTGTLPSTAIAPERLGTQTAYAFFAGENKLSGPFPGHLFEQCDRLSTIMVNVSNNRMPGQVPADIGTMCNSLKFLDASGNQIVGPLPRGVGELMSLVALNLNWNLMHGQIPTSLGQIKSLNSVLGNPHLHPCEAFSLTVPSSDMQEAGDPQNYAAAPVESPVSSGSRGFNSIEIASITSASAIVSVLLALIVLFFYTRRWNPQHKIGSTRKEVTIFTDIGVPLTFENVVQATGNFTAGNCIGNGGFGATYKAEISPGVLVAIKRLAFGRFQVIQQSQSHGIQQFEQFHAEIKTLGRLRHPNLVTLIVAWACMLLRQGRAKEFFTAGLWDAGPHDDLVEVLHLAVVCTVDTLSTRPTMKQVVRRLKQLQPPSC